MTPVYTVNFVDWTNRTIPDQSKVLDEFKELFCMFLTFIMIESITFNARNPREPNSQHTVNVIDDENKIKQLNLDYFYPDFYTSVDRTLTFLVLFCDFIEGIQFLFGTKSLKYSNALNGSHKHLVNCKEDHEFVLNTSIPEIKGLVLSHCLRQMSTVRTIDQHPDSEKDCELLGKHSKNKQLEDRSRW